MNYTRFSPALLLTRCWDLARASSLLALGLSFFLYVKAGSPESLPALNPPSWGPGPLSPPCFKDMGLPIGLGATEVSPVPWLWNKGLRLPGAR